MARSGGTKTVTVGGARGAAGAPGTQGIQGIQGIQGPPGPPGGGSPTAVTIVAPATATEHRITVTDALILPAMKMTIGWGNISDADENNPEMDAVSFRAIPGTGSFVAVISSQHPIRGPFKVLYTAGL